MRALFFDGQKDRRVRIPGWVTFAPRLGLIAADCSRCGASETVDMLRRDAERAMGRFALWHDRCRDAEEVREAVRRAKARVRPVWERGAPVVYFRPGRPANTAVGIAGEALERGEKGDENAS